MTDALLAYIITLAVSLPLALAVVQLLARRP